jgi:hypothetical protein
MFGSACRAAQIGENEAIALAEWWYANEINAKTTPLPEAEKQARVAGRSKHQVHYLLGANDLKANRKSTDAVSAYVIAFEPSGFVVISGEDALQPVLVFNATHRFRWDSPEKSFLSQYLGGYVASAVKGHRSARQPTSAHRNWAALRKQMASSSLAPAYAAGTGSGGGTAIMEAAASSSDIYVKLPTATWGQGSPYNHACVARNGNNQVPTGCTATAMAIKMRYHKWPNKGNDSHSYSDSRGTVKYSHSVDFSQSSYDWSAMPTNSLTTANADVANLMYDCGVAVNMNYETSGSGSSLAASDMNNYFRYRGTRHEDLLTGSEDMKRDIAYSIRCGLPTIINTSNFKAILSGSNLNHTLVACGYRERTAAYFYLNCGWGGTSDDAWYDLDQIITPTFDLGSMVGAYPFSSPDNYAYVDNEWSGIVANGDLNTPYDSLSDGVSGVTKNGVLMVKAGNYGAITLTKSMTVKSYLGTAVIGN